MTKRSFRPGSVRAAAFALAVAMLVGVAWPALAAVTLTTFQATAQPDNTIRVYWAAETELDTASYNLYRSETSAPADWGAPVTQKAAGGSIAPAEYEYIDVAVTPGITYYYMLEDISTSGQKGTNGPVSARILLAGETPTNTPTATATWTGVPTATTGPGTNPSGATPTPTQPPPTATRQYTNTPVPVAGTPVLSAPTRQATLVVAQRLTPTRLPGAALATPTGQPQPLATAAIMPVVTQQPTLAPVQLPEQPTATVAVATQAPAAGQETATPVPTREVTPIVFAPETQEAAPDGAAQAVASQDGRNVNGALAFGGAALGLAGVLAAVYLFLRSRKG